MKKKIRKIIYLIIFMLVLCIGYYVFNDNKVKSANDNSVTYLLNTRTKRVHSKNCGVGKRAKEKNKQYRSDSLSNIVNDGYKICGDCNAGVKKSIITNLLSLFDDPINMDYDGIVLPTREEYLKAVEEVGEWYVNYIPTYCKQLQEEKVIEYQGVYKNIDSIKLGTKGKLSSKLYKYVTSKTTSATIETLKDSEMILRANENAIYNYDSIYSKIDIKGGILQYPCDLINKCPSYNKAGDDCVRYVFTVLNNIDSQFVERIAKSSQKTWSKINTAVFNSDDAKFVDAMIKNGFQIYASKERLNDSRILEMGATFKLEKGDIICREGHIHVYIGNNGTDNFGWGKVNRYYPANYYFSIESDNNEYVIKMDKGNAIEYYTKVYRYIGGAQE